MYLSNSSLLQYLSSPFKSCIFPLPKQIARRSDNRSRRVIACPNRPSRVGVVYTGGRGREMSIRLRHCEELGLIGSSTPHFA